MESPSSEDRLKNISAFIKTSQERYEREKEDRADRFRRLQQTRQSILVDRAEILSRLNSAAHKAREKIPLYETKIRVVRDENAVRRRLMAQPYRGELGIGSYEAWQLEDFYFVRDFVQSWIDEILDYVVCQPSRNRDGFAESVHEMQEQLELEQYELSRTSAIQGVQDDILDEVCNDLVCEAVSVSLAIHYQAQQTISNMILRGILPAEGTEENRETLLSYTYLQMKKERNKQHKVWHHTQHLVYINDEGAEIPEGEEDQFDGNILSLEGIIPYDNIPDHMFLENFLTYRDSESKFWSGFSDPIYSILPLPKRYKGISCATLSSDHSLLAVAATQGDLAVWDLSIYPPRVLKGCKRNSTVISMEWSLDSTQILTLDKHGTIQMWSMLNANSSIIDLKGFEPVEENLGFKTTELKSVLHLEPQDLLFTTGNLVSMNEDVAKPTTITFFPDFSFFGRQESMMVGLVNGNVLKLNLGRSRAAQRVHNKVGKGIEAELFQAHKHAVQRISFVNNESPMITVDTQGYVHLWENNESMSGFGWYTPIASFRLDSTEKTYEPAEGSVEKVEFVDTVKGTGKIKELNRSDMIEKRKQTQTFINSLHLGRPWKTQYVGEKKINYLYAPRSVPESGATFHSVTYYKDTKVLSRYATLLFQPIRVDCTKILSCTMNSSGNRLVFSLLFGHVPPKTPHVRFVILEIPAMKISPNVIEVGLSEEEYKECNESGSCGCDLTKVINATGSEYIITNVCGTIGGFSMTTGNLIMASGESGWTGCDMGKNQPPIFSTARIKVASQASVLCVLFYAPRQHTAILLHLRDKSTSVVRQQVWQDWHKLKGGKVIPAQQTWHKKQWAFDGEFAFHPECTMESLVLELVDAAVGISEGIDHSKWKSVSRSMKNKILPFVRHFPAEENAPD